MTDDTPGEPVQAPGVTSPILIGHDFELSGPGLKAEAEPETAAPEPRIVVQRRGGWWSPFVLPSLIIAITVIVTIYRPPWRYRGIPWRERSVSVPKPIPTVVEKPELRSSQSETPGPATIPGVNLAEAPPLADDLPRPGPEILRPSMAVLQRPELVFTEPAKPARIEPQPAPAVAAKPDETANALALIQKEAAQKRADQVNAAALMDQLPKLERDRHLKAVQKVDDLRRPFRTELHRVLEQFGDEAGPKILDLAEQYNVEPLPGVEQAIKVELRQRRGRIGMTDRIALFRAHGLPEPVILIDLYNEQMKKGPARNGPRNKDEAMVRAARLLLSVPLTASQVSLSDSVRSPRRNLEY